MYRDAQNCMRPADEKCVAPGAKGADSKGRVIGNQLSAAGRPEQGQRT